MRVRKITALCMVVVLIVLSVVGFRASAAENNDWIELLEFSTVNDSGTNLISISGTSGIFRIKTPQYMRCTKVDMILTHPSGYAPTSVNVRFNNVYYGLTLQKIDAYTTRVYGSNIPDSLYADLVFQINKGSDASATYQVLSCKVTSLLTSVMSATAYADIAGTRYDVPFAMEGSDEGVADVWAEFQFPVIVTDWQKFDKITISGSCGAMALNSVRVTVGSLGLPFEMSYAVSNSSGSSSNSYTWNEIKYYTYDESYKGTSQTETFLYSDYRGKVLFTITIDLTGVDRTVPGIFGCYFTGLANPVYGYTVQIMGVTGSVDVADTSEISWWQRFVSFMQGLFSPDSSDSDEYQEEAGQQRDELDQMNQQLENVTKPPVDGIQMDVNDYIDSGDTQALAGALAALTGDSLMISMMCIVLTIALVGYVLYGKR